MHQIKCNLPRENLPNAEFKIISRGTWIAQSVKRLPLAQVMILESLDELHVGLPSSVGSLLLRLSLPLTLVLSLSNK